MECGQRSRKRAVLDLHFIVQPKGCWNTRQRRRRQVNAVPGFNGTTRGDNQHTPGMRLDPIPVGHPPYRQPLRQGSLQHGLPAKMRICAATGLGGAADKRYLLSLTNEANVDVVRHRRKSAGHVAKAT